jgi:hypothetical protein
MAGSHVVVETSSWTHADFQPMLVCSRSLTDSTKRLELLQRHLNYVIRVSKWTLAAHFS